MIAVWSRTTLMQLPVYALPVIVPLIDGRAVLLVQPEHDKAAHHAAQRAAACLGGEAMALWAQSPQDWQFERLPARGLSEAEWLGLREQLQASSQWGPLVACGVALGQLA